MSATSFCETVVEKYTILALFTQKPLVEASNLFRVQQQLLIRRRNHALMRTMETVVIQLSNDAASTVTKSNGDLVSSANYTQWHTTLKIVLLDSVNHHTP